MNKIRLSIQFNQGYPYYMKLEWIELMNMALLQRTKDYVEKGNLDLRILAVLIKETMLEAKNVNEIDGVLWNKLHDSDLVIKLMGEII